MKKRILGCAHDFEGVWVEAGGSAHAWPTTMMAIAGRVLRALWEHAGIISFFVTGRPAAYMEAANQCVGKLSMVPDVFENGAVLRQSSGGRWRAHPQLLSDDLLLYGRVKEELRRIAREMGASEEVGKNICASFNPLPNMSTAEFFKDFWSVASQDRVVSDLRGKKPLTEIVNVVHTVSAIDVTPAGINKRAGLDVLCRALGWNPAENVAAIGDTKGDFPILEYVALPMCPSNAIEEVKELVRSRNGYVSDFPTVVGAVDCMIQLVKDKSKQVQDEVYVESQFVFGNLNNEFLRVPRQNSIPHLTSPYDDCPGLQNLFQR